MERLSMHLVSNSVFTYSVGLQRYNFDQSNTETVMWLDTNHLALPVPLLIPFNRITPHKGRISRIL